LDPLISANAIVASANIAVLIALLVLYAKVYQSSKAKFTIGLMLFVSLLMLHNIIAVYGYFIMESLYSPTLIPYFFAIHVSELGGLFVLFRITLL
jgi:hypothetical protein